MPRWRETRPLLVDDLARVAQVPGEHGDHVDLRRAEQVVHVVLAGDGADEDTLMSLQMPTPMRPRRGRRPPASSWPRAALRPQRVGVGERRLARDGDERAVEPHHHRRVVQPVASAASRSAKPTSTAATLRRRRRPSERRPSAASATGAARRRGPNGHEGELGEDEEVEVVRRPGGEQRRRLAIDALTLPCTAASPPIDSSRSGAARAAPAARRGSSRPGREALRSTVLTR